MLPPDKRPRGEFNSRDTASRVKRDERIGWRLVGLGVQVTSEVCAGALGGFLYDHFTKSEEHWGVLIGGCLGILVALSTLIRMGWKINKELEGSGPPPSNRDHSK